MRIKNRFKLAASVRQAIWQSKDLNVRQKLAASVFLMMPGGLENILEAVKGFAEADAEVVAADWLDDLERLLQLLIKYLPEIIKLIEILFPS